MTSGAVGRFPRTYHQQIGSMGGLTTHALHDPRETMKKVRAGKTAKFRAQVLQADPDLTDEAEIARRVDRLQRAEMTRLSRLAARARRLKAEGTAVGRGLETAGPDDNHGIDA